MKGRRTPTPVCMHIGSSPALDRGVQACCNFHFSIWSGIAVQLQQNIETNHLLPCLMFLPRHTTLQGAMHCAEVPSTLQDRLSITGLSPLTGKHGRGRRPYCTHRISRCACRQKEAIT